MPALRHTGISVDSLRRIADNLDLLADRYEREQRQRHAATLRNNAAVLRRDADQTVKLESRMGRVADDIAKLTADRDAQKHRADTAESQLSSAQANALDATDLAALDKLEADLAAGSGTPAPAPAPAPPTP